MPLVPIPINKGVYENVDPFEINSPDVAAVLKNFLINDAGSNVGRPGLSDFAQMANSPVIGATVFNDLLFVVTEDRKMYSISSTGVATNVTGLLLGGTSRPVFASDGTYLAIAGGAAPQQWTGTGNTALLAGSPPNCTHIVYLDGYWITFLIDDQELRWAGPTSAARATWSTANFFSAEGLPDNIKAIEVNLRELYVFGSETTEIFYNYGDTSTPFKRTFFMEKGILAPYSYVKADNTLWWLDSDRRIVKMEGRTPTLLSSPFDRVIKQFTTVDDCWAARIDIDGFYLIAWTFPTEGRTFVYDYKNQVWSEWDSFFNGLSSQMKMSAYAYNKAWNMHFIGDPFHGSVFEFSFDNFSDGDRARRLIRRSGQIDHGSGNRKRSNYYLFHVKRGLGTNGNTEPLMQIRVNDDGAGWSEPVLIGLGFSGDEQKPVRFSLSNIYRKRQIEVQVTDEIEFVINKIEEFIDVMSS